MRPALLLALACVACKEKPAPPAPIFLGVEACSECHADRVKTFRETDHHHTSTLPSHDAIRGRFEPPHNELETRNPQLRFRMEAAADGFSVIAMTGSDALRMRIDYVVGSGAHGQSFLHWDGDRLLQLPVGWFRALGHWANNPGHKDGQATIKPILPRCLECHATYVEPVDATRRENRFKKETLLLGIACERCHGPGLEHVAHHRANKEDKEGKYIVHPGELERDRALDICGQCHAGVGEPLGPSFAFRAGGRLSDHVRTKEELSGHASNQIAALRASVCYQRSPKMTCMSCHDPHERSTEPRYRACLQCHVEKAHAGKALQAIRDDCTSCHMPLREDPTLGVEFATGKVFATSRDHRIAIH